MAVGLNGENLSSGSRPRFWRNAKIAAIFPDSVTFKLRRALSAKWISREYNPCGVEGGKGGFLKSEVHGSDNTKLQRSSTSRGEGLEREREVDCKI